MLTLDEAVCGPETPAGAVAKVQQLLEVMDDQG
jgi:hypothetical protein